MTIRFTKQFLSKLEDLFAESDYTLRYEKGSFNSGYCLINDTKVAIVNKYFTVEGKINCLLDILKAIELNASTLSDKNQKLFSELSQTTLKL